MLFSIQFQVDPLKYNDDSCVMKRQSCDFGFNLIKNIQKIIGDETFPTSNIMNNTQCDISRGLRITIPENMAFSSKRFLNTSEITVHVPNEFLTPYQSLGFKQLYYYDFQITSILKNKKIRIPRVCLYNIVHTTKILCDWAKCGFPLHWTEDVFNENSLNGKLIYITDDSIKYHSGYIRI